MRRRGGRTGRNGTGYLKRNLGTPRERLRDQVGHALRVALISGELEPGQVYSAPGLAEDFGIFATPVREAMLDLVREGLMEPVRNKGFRVTEMPAAGSRSSPVRRPRAA